MHSMLGKRCRGLRRAYSQAVEFRFELQEEVGGGFDGRLEILGLTGRHLSLFTKILLGRSNRSGNKYHPFSGV